MLTSVRTVMSTPDAVCQRDALWTVPSDRPDTRVATRRLRSRNARAGLGRPVPGRLRSAFVPRLYTLGSCLALVAARCASSAHVEC